MNNKKILLIVVAIAIIIFIGYFIFAPKKQNDVIPAREQTSEEISLKTEADEVINKWGNFSDNTTSDYLDSIKPYLSEEALALQREDAEAQKFFNDKQGKPMAQKYSVNKVELISRGEEDVPLLTYKISATREIDGNKSDSVTFVKYQKIDNEWKIISIESD